MSGMFLTDDALQEYRNTSCSMHTGQTHTSDGTEVKLPAVIHALVGTLGFCQTNSPIFDPKVTAELDADDIQNRIADMRRIDIYLDKFNTPQADEHVTEVPKTYIRNALADVHQWFSKDDTTGKHHREAIALAMNTLGLGSPEQGPNTAGLNTPQNPDGPSTSPWKKK